MLPVNVLARVRPVMDGAGETSDGVQVRVKVNTAAQEIVSEFGRAQKTYTFTHALGPDSDQKTVWDAVGAPAIEDIWRGQNVAFLSYGPRGSGKRFTTLGTPREAGLVPRLSEALFSKITAAKSDGGSSFKVELSFYESYCESLNDLLSLSKRGLQVAAVPDMGVAIGGLTRCPVDGHATLLKILNAALVARSVRATALNVDTAQAHSFFHLVLTRTSVDPGTMKAVETTASCLVADIGETGGANTDHVSEATTSPGHAHAALRALVSHLIAKRRKSAGKPSESKESQEASAAAYARSQLTQLLRGALGGHSKTTLLLALAPTDIDEGATSSALDFADRFRRIVNSTSTGVDRRLADTQALKASIAALRQQIAATSSVDPSYDRITAAMNASKDTLDVLAKPWDARLRDVDTVFTELDVQHMDAIEQARAEMPHLANISRDSSMSGRVLHFLQPGKTQFGLAKDPNGQLEGRHDAGLGGNNSSVGLVGLSLDPNHCAIKNEGGNLTLLNMSDTTCVQGKELHPSDEVALNDGDWIVLGKLFDGHIYEVVIPTQRAAAAGRKAPKSPALVWSQIAEVMSQKQLAGLQRQQKLVTMRPPAAIAMKRRVLFALPQVDEANTLAKSLSRPKKFDMNIIATGGGHAARGRRLSSVESPSPGGGGNSMSLDIEVIVQQNDGNIGKPAVWPEAKFLDRVFRMREMHWRFLTVFGRNASQLNEEYPQDTDPFFDPLQDVHVGTAIAYLNPFSYVVAIDQPITILDDRGSAEGELMLEMVPRVFRDEFMQEAIDTDDENEPRLEHYIGGTLQIDLSITGARHLNPNKCEGVYVTFAWLGDDDETKVPPSLDNASRVSLAFKRTYELEVTRELVKLVTEDVVEFRVMCKGNSKNMKSTAPRLGFLSDVGVSAVPSFTPRGGAGSDSKLAGPNHSNRSGGASKTSGGGSKTGGETGLAGYGSAVDAHKNELEKEAMRRRIAELEEELSHSKSKSSACTLL
jgi:kinesin family member 1